MKNFRTSLIYGIVAVFLGGYIYFFDRGPVKEKGADEKKLKIFEKFVADDITQIHLENLATTVTAEKSPVDIQKDDKGIWQVVAPKKLQADESMVRTLLAGVGDYTPDSSIENPTNLDQFGLVKPAVKSVFKTKAGVSFQIIVGDKNAAGSDNYVQTAGKNTIYLLPTYSLDALKKNVDDFRDHNFIKTDLVSAKKVRVRRGRNVFEFEKDKNNVWNITEPIKEKAEEGKVRDLLSNLNGLRIDRFVADAPKNLSGYGLSAPRVEVEVWPSDGGPSKTILLGRKKEKEAFDYAKTADLPAVYLVGDYLDKGTDIKIDDFRDKSAMRFDAAKALSFTVKRGAKTWTYQKGDKGQWTAEGRAAANDEGINIISQLSLTSITDFAPKDALTGLADPSFIVVVALSDKTSRTFRFGKRSENQVYLASDLNQEVYRVSSGIISQLEVYFSAVLTPIPAVTAAVKPSK